MYQVMIVDDEEPVLDSFTYILEKDVTDFDLCGKARSGMEAVNMIRNLTPDLVFMDIQMPGIDGIEAIRQIRPQFPNTVFILATAYERFDIAQKAIPLGIFSYMVKPISKKAFLEELSKVKNHLDQLRSRDYRNLEDIQLLHKTKKEETNRFLSSLIWRDLGDQEWSKLLGLFNISCDRGTLYLFEVSGDIAEDVKIDLYESVTEKIQYKFNCLSTVVAGRMMIFFPEERSLKNLSFYFNNILNELKPYRFVLGQGKVYPLSKLHLSFSEALKPFSDAYKKEESCSARRKKMQMICRSIFDVNNPQAGNMFEEYWMNIFSNMEFSVALGKMVALFTIILDKMNNYIPGGQNFNIDPAEEIMVLKSVDEWQQWSCRTIKHLREQNQNNIHQSYPRLLTAALTYIREKYQKPLQLSLVAEKHGITGSYLSRLFKEHLGTTFIEYLNRYRLNKAIILLETKEYSIKEIAYIVGYQDPNYFSRIFRRHMGISPSDMDKGGINDD